MEFDEVVVKENPGLCRCCLSEGCYKDMSTEYAWMNETEVYADMLLECFDISISQVNDGPNGPNRLICEVCITRLRDACYFKKQVLDTEKKFIDMVARGEFKTKAMLVYPSSMKAETAETELYEGDEGEAEYLEDDMDVGDDDHFKTEEDEPSASASGVTADPLPMRAKRGRPRKTPTKSDTKKIKTEPKPKTSKAKGKRRKIIFGRHTKDALRSKRNRQLKRLDQRLKPPNANGGRPKKAKKDDQNMLTIEIAEIRSIKHSKGKKPRPKKPIPLSKAEKTAYQFAKPILNAPITKNCYNPVIQQHLSMSNVGVAAGADDEGDSSRETILQHMKMAMGRVKLGTPSLKKNNSFNLTRE